MAGTRLSQPKKFRPASGNLPPEKRTSVGKTSSYQEIALSCSDKSTAIQYTGIVISLSKDPIKAISRVVRRDLRGGSPSSLSLAPDRNVCAARSTGPGPRAMSGLARRSAHLLATRAVFRRAGAVAPAATAGGTTFFAAGFFLAIVAVGKSAFLAAFRRIGRFLPRRCFHRHALLRPAPPPAPHVQPNGLPYRRSPAPSPRPARLSSSAAPTRYR